MRRGAWAGRSQNLVNLLGIPSPLNFALIGGVILTGVIAGQQFMRYRQHRTSCRTHARLDQPAASSFLRAQFVLEHACLAFGGFPRDLTPLQRLAWERALGMPQAWLDRFLHWECPKVALA